MIIWLNGAFGSGKTQTANELEWRIPNAYVYDPEEAGFFIRKNLPRGLERDDFQNFKMWRDFNYDMLKYICDTYQGTIIVPMTITNESYFNEIIGKLRLDAIPVEHFTLMATKETLIKRLSKRGDGKNSWPAQQIDRCIRALSNPLFEQHLYTDAMSIGQVVETIGEVCNIELIPDHRSWLIRKRDKFRVWVRHIRLFG